MERHRVGIIGLGQMGSGMAASLCRAGFETLGHDLDPARRVQAAALGVHVHDTPQAVLSQADVLVFSLPYARDVEAVATADNGVLQRRDRRVVIVDTSTSDPTTTRRLAAALAVAGHGLLDAPVSGGPSGAQAGTLTMMVGGLAADLDAARPVLDAMAARIVHVGASGAGNVAKLVNNLLVAQQLITAQEALRLSEAAGLPAQAALEVVNAATGRSAATEAMVPRWVLPGRFDSGFTAGLMRKDVTLALALAQELGLELPLAQAGARLWQAARDRMPDDADFTRMADFRNPPTEAA
ncbi:MAG: NAD(P)-dependent oxidoreductase [Rubrivivax sp.]|jgi:3-hydroxyisobutyrate dehydrogenase